MPGPLQPGQMFYDVESNETSWKTPFKEISGERPRLLTYQETPDMSDILSATTPGSGGSLSLFC